MSHAVLQFNATSVGVHLIWGLGEWAEVEDVAGAVWFVGPDEHPGFIEQVGHECNPGGRVDESTLTQFGGDGAAVEGVEQRVEGIEGGGDGGVGARQGEQVVAVLVEYLLVVYRAVCHESIMPYVGDMESWKSGLVVMWLSWMK